MVLTLIAFSSSVRSNISRCNVIVFHMLLSLSLLLIGTFVKLENSSVQVLFAMMVMISWEIHLLICNFDKRATGRYFTTVCTLPQSAKSLSKLRMK